MQFDKTKSITRIYGALNKTALAINKTALAINKTALAIGKSALAINKIALAVPRITLATALGLLILSGCDSTPKEARQTPAPAETQSTAAPVPGGQAAPELQRLKEVLAMQADSIKTRYEARHPLQTLSFFGIEPGMTVIEADPSGGWYSGILQAYLGEGGTLIGADYPLGVYRLFDYYSDEELALKATWAARWPGERTEGLSGGAQVEAYSLGSMPASLQGSVDAVLLVRVLHNLADFEDEGAYLSNALDEIYRALKGDGVVGIVQHSAPESHADAWASGANGYLKKSFVVEAMETAGFVFAGESAINENPADRPTEDEAVWRLAPTLEEVEDPGLAATYAAIGESNRMTLRFRKPGA